MADREARTKRPHAVLTQNIDSWSLAEKTVAQMTNTDCAIRLGSSHPICQDYARAGWNKIGPYAIIADGCSSSPDTDIGARLVVMAAECGLNGAMPLTSENADDFHEMTISLASTWAMKMGLPFVSLDATLMTLSTLENGKILTTIYGDGMIVAKIPDGLLVMEVSYPRNFPVYPSYLLDLDRTKRMPVGNAIQLNLWRVTPDAGKQILMVNDGPIKDGMHDCLFAHEFNLPEDGFIAAVTDGAKSFLAPLNSETTKTNGSVPLEQVLPELLGFKNFHPGFVQRRMQRFARDAQKKEWQHYDDLAMGAIALRKEDSDGKKEE